MRKVIRIGLKGKPKVTPGEMALTINLKSRVELIQALIPIGLEAVAEELKHEVEELAGDGKRKPYKCSPRRGKVSMHVKGRIIQQ